MRTKNHGGRFGLSGMGLAGLTVLATLLIQGCSNPIDDAVGAPIPAEAHKRQASGNLAPGDVITISYPGAPEMNLSQKIRPDGRLSLPMIGDVRAAGKSPTSFQSELQRRYQDNLQDPKVVVAILTAAAAVYVSGEVRAPAKISLDRPMTALEAIMEAGGFTPVADPRKVSVVRTVSSAHQRFNINMNDVMSGKAKAFYLQPYDVVYVGQRMW